MVFAITIRWYTRRNAEPICRRSRSTLSCLYFMHIISMNSIILKKEKCNAWKNTGAVKAYTHTNNTKSSIQIHRSIFSMNKYGLILTESFSGVFEHNVHFNSCYICLIGLLILPILVCHFIYGSLLLLFFYLLLAIFGLIQLNRTYRNLWFCLNIETYDMTL